MTKRLLNMRPPLGARLRAEREKARLTQVQLAWKLGLSSYTVAAAESGLRVPKREDLRRLTAYLKIDWHETLALLAKGGYLVKVQFYTADQRVLRLAKYLAGCNPEDATLEELINTLNMAERE